MLVILATNTIQKNNTHDSTYGNHNHNTNINNTNDSTNVNNNTTIMQLIMQGIVANIINNNTTIGNDKK